MKKFVTDTLFVTGAGLLNRSKGILFIPLIIAAVGFDGYGAFVQILLTLRIVSSLSTLELGMGFPRFVAQVPAQNTRELGRHFHSVLLPTLVSSALGGLLFYAAADVLSALFFDHGYQQSLRIAAVVVFSNSCFATARNYLRARAEFKQESLLTLCYEILPYLGFVLLATSRGNLHSGMLAYVAIDVAVALGILLSVLRSLSWAAPSFALSKQYLRYSFPLALSLVEGGLLARADLYFISYFLGLSAVATYNVIYRVTELISFVSIPIHVQLLTYLSRTWDRGHLEASREIIRKTLLFFLLLTMGMLACLALYFEPLFVLFLGKPPSEAHLWLIVMLIGVGMMANTARRFLYVLIRLHRTTQHELFYQLAGLTLNATCNYFLIPIYGLAGAAFSTLVSYALMLPLISLHYPLGLKRAFVGHALSFAVLALVIVPLRYAIPPDSLPLLCLSAGVAYAAYLALVGFFKRKLLISLRDELLEWRRLTYSAPVST